MPTAHTVPTVPTAQTVPTEPTWPEESDERGRGPEGGTDRPALRRCTALDPDRFAERIWGREASLTRAADLPAGFDDLFSLDAADQVMSRQGLRTPFLRVAKDGSTLPAARFTTGGGVGAGIADQASDVQLTRLFADGSTIVLQALHRTHAPVADFAGALAADLGHPVQVNAYLTPAASQGFSAHYDVHDVFVLQISGRKRWRIHRPVHPLPLRDQPWTDHRSAVDAAAREEPLIDEVLEPGDALYLPRGYLHAATALGGTSAHLTFGVHVWTRRHLLELLLAATGGVEELRATLPLGIDVTDPVSMHDELTRTVEALMRRLPDIGSDLVATGLVDAALQAGKAGPVGPLAQAAAVAAVGPDDMVRWRAGLRVALEVGPDLLVRTPDGDVRLPLVAMGALERLRRGDVLAVRELGGPDVEADLALARTLLRECLTVPA